ncbi:hypothetical protein FVER53590_25119 [Fusarium verticillioides]|nr:hypothetical protein FVER53590_25119 [Fusarium verticillioides]
MSSAYEGQVAWPTHRALIEQSHNGLQFILEKVNSNFKYDKLLNNDFFRIFELKPGKDDEPLKGTLRTYLRKEAPRYEALSYVWGSPLLDKHIKCNDRRIKITSSLDLVLKRLRLTSDSRFLWIDQICINQACLEERTEQVCIMRDIYSEAALVNAWLGPADPGDAATRPTDDSYLNAFTAFAFRSFVASFVKIDDGEMPESNTSADQDGDRCSSPNVTK